MTVRKLNPANVKATNRRPLSEVETKDLYSSTSFNISHRGCTFYLSFPFWMITPLYKNTMSSTRRDRAQINTNYKLKQKHNTMTSAFRLYFSRSSHLDRLCSDISYKSLKTDLELPMECSYCADQWSQKL